MPTLLTLCEIKPFIKICRACILLIPLSLMTLSCGSGGSSQKQDPLVVDKPLAYVKRPVPVDNNNDIISANILDPDAFSVNGAGLYIRDRASQSASEVNITDSAFPSGSLYDVKDVEVSYDGRKLLFAMRGPLDPDADDEDQPSWNIWEYDLDTGTLLRLITDTIKAEDGQDISPAYLADGRIVFTSNRQVRSRSVLLDEIKPSTSTPGAGFSATVDDDEIFNLHILDPINDPLGSNIKQITFSQGHDLEPTVLSDGKIAFLRWDMNDGRDKLSIYTINADGSNLRILYGYHSQQTGNTSNNQTTFIDLREQSDGSLSAILQERESAQLGGDIIAINAQGFTDINQPTNDNSGDTDPGQNSLSVGTVNLDGGISTHGYFNSAYPLADGSSRFLVSWNPCRLQDPVTDAILACSPTNLANTALTTAPPAYGLWVYDSAGGTQSPVASAQLGQMYTDAVIMESRALPPVSEANQATFDPELEDVGVAVLHIRSVYDTDGNDTTTSGIDVMADPAQTLAAARPARFLRLIKPVSIPSEDILDFNTDVAFGISQARGMREILGYTPIEPDGSIKVQAPADVAFYFDVVNDKGERVMPLHRNLLQLKAGETYECKGCHTANSTIPHGRDGDVDTSGQLITLTEPPTANPGAAQIGLPFPNTEPALFAESGETMGEVYARINTIADVSGARTLDTGLVYTDDWTDPTVRAKDTDYNLLYSGDINFAGLTSPAPASSGCQTTWQAVCRIVINYQDQIQPLWEVDRLDGMGGNNKCVACHSRLDAMNNLQQPAGQLELTNGPSTAEPLHYTSYHELLEQDIPQIINPDGDAFLPLFVFDVVNNAQQFYLDINGDQILDMNGAPIPRVRTFSPGDDNVANIRIQSFTGNVVDIYLDAMGDPILDAANNPIEITIPIDPSDIPNGPAMRVSNAAGSSFFDKMEGNAGTVDHSAFMSINELRMIREWLDIGGQYYNNPFDAPLN
jgi:hypothetical protein